MHALAPLTLLSLLSLTACGASAQALDARAEVALDCPRDALQRSTIVDALGTGKTVKVVGCGRQATFVQVCPDGPLGGCAWTQ